MSNEQGYLDNIKLVYGVDDNPSISKKIIFGIQHIFAAFGGIIVVPLVIASRLNVKLNVKILMFGMYLKQLLKNTLFFLTAHLRFTV